MSSPHLSFSRVNTTSSFISISSHTAYFPPHNDTLIFQTGNNWVVNNWVVVVLLIVIVNDLKASA